jgi:hypothetical protein
MLRTTFCSGTGSGFVDAVHIGLAGTEAVGATTPPGPQAVKTPASATTIVSLTTLKIPREPVIC